MRTLQEELQKVLNADIGYTKFFAAYNRETGHAEILCLRHDELVWFNLGYPTDPDLLQFAAEIPFRCTLEPKLADWGRILERGSYAKAQ